MSFREQLEMSTPHKALCTTLARAAVSLLVPDWGRPHWGPTSTKDPVLALPPCGLLAQGHGDMGDGRICASCLNFSKFCASLVRLQI